MKRYSPLTECGTEFHLSVTAFIPRLGVAKLERATANVSREWEKAIHESAASIPALQKEIQLLSQTVIQNRLALDHLLEVQDRVCALVWRMHSTPP